MSNDEWDDSISVHGFITINYSTTTLSNGQKEYLLTSVSGRWTKSDNHVTMSGKRVAYTCHISQFGGFIVWRSFNS